MGCTASVCPTHLYYNRLLERNQLYDISSAASILCALRMQLYVQYNHNLVQPINPKPVKLQRQVYIAVVYAVVYAVALQWHFEKQSTCEKKYFNCFVPRCCSQPDRFGMPIASEYWAAVRGKMLKITIRPSHVPLLYVTIFRYCCKHM